MKGIKEKYKLKGDDRKGGRKEWAEPPAREVHAAPPPPSAPAEEHEELAAAAERSRGDAEPPDPVAAKSILMPSTRSMTPGWSVKLARRAKSGSSS